MALDQEAFVSLLRALHGVAPAQRYAGEAAALASTALDLMAAVDWAAYLNVEPGNICVLVPPRAG